MRNSRTSSRTARGLRSRPVLQPLEDRCVPTTYTDVATFQDLIGDIKLLNNTGIANTIVLRPNVTFSLPGAENTADGPNGLPVITNQDLTIIGSNDVIQRSTAKGTAAFRLFDVAAGASLSLTATPGSGFTLQNGLITGGTRVFTAADAAGGAILNRGSLALTGVTVRNNTARGADGASESPGGAALGGGIYSVGTLTLDGCLLQNNQTIGGQGGPGHLFTDRTGGKDTTAGRGGEALGGGLYAAGGTVTLRTSRVTGNGAQGGKAGGKYAGDGWGKGGGIYVASTATAYLDGPTAGQVTGNSASTSDPEISGGLQPHLSGRGRASVGRPGSRREGIDRRAWATLASVPAAGPRGKPGTPAPTPGRISPPATASPRRGPTSSPRHPPPPSGPPARGDPISRRYARKRDAM